MNAIEVWINGEKKCVAGTEGNVLTAILNAMRDMNLSVGGIIYKEGQSYHVDWLREPLKVGDEVRLRLIETEEVDPPIREERSQTQAEGDDRVRTHLLNARAMLPSTLSEQDNASLALFEQKIEEENFVGAMRTLGTLGEKNTSPTDFWKEIGWVAFLLRRYDEAGEYRARRIQLEGSQEGGDS